MAFKGSTKVPSGDVIRILQRLGLAFGADTNASTGWTETVYEFDLPHSDAESLDTGLMLLREIGSELTLDPALLESERGVVLSEERLRDTPGYRAQRAQIDLFLHDQLAAKRFPIGQVDIIKHAPVSLIRRYYQDNYRPDRTTLVAVGDFDPDQMEAKIKARFASWTNPATAEPTPDLGAVEPRGATVKLVQVPGGASEVVIAWARPFDASLDTSVKESRQLVENLGLAVLNRRLGRLARAEAPPFLTAQVGFQSLFHSEKIAVAQSTAAPGEWRKTLAATDMEVRRLVAEGVSPAELAREVTEMRTTFKAAADGAATRPTPTLAQGFVDNIDDDEVSTSPAEDLRVFDHAVQALTVAQVNSAVKAVFSGAGPLVELVTPETVEGGEGAVSRAFAEAVAAPLTSRAAQAEVKWPYASFGAPGVVVDRSSVADLGLQRVRFANGVTLTVKPTKFRDDQILISVRVGQGRLELPRDVASPIWAANALISGGLSRISFEDTQVALAGTVHSAGFSVEDNAFALTGATRPADLAVELELLAAYVADPGFRPEAFERLRTAYLAQLPQLDATPGGVLAREGSLIFSGGDKRFAFPDRQTLLNAKPADLRVLLAGVLGHEPVEITIVGDITPEAATAAVAATFGALPNREASRPIAKDALVVRFPRPTPEPLTLTHTGRADQAVGVVAWPLTGFYTDMRRSRAEMLAGEVLGNRLIDQVRIAEGSTYSPEARVDLSQVFPDYGIAAAEVEMPPAKLPGFYASAHKIAVDMSTTGITEDELVRARAPRIAGLAKSQLTNEYWLADLSGSIAEPRKLDLIRSTFPDYNAVTSDDIRQVAKTWLTDDKAFRIRVVSAEAK